MRNGVLVCACLALLAVAGCGDSSESSEERGRQAFERVFAAIEGLDGERRERKLRGMAEREGGQLTLYTSLLPGVDDEIAGAFEDEHDVEVSVYRATSETLAQRLTEEARADFRGTDVVETNGVEMSTLRRDGLLVPYRPAAAAGLIRGALQDGWTTSRLSKFEVSWNSEQVPRGRGPRSLEELTRPQWKGLLAMESGDADWYKTLRDHWIEREGRSEAQADRLFEALARNSRVVNGHALLTELMGAGEFAAAVSTYSYQTRAAIRKGAPLEVRPTVQPIISRPQGVGLLTTAEHPAAAVLFVEWLLDEGQELLRENDVDVARRDLATGARDEVFVDVDAFLRERKQWDDRYERLLRLGEEVRGGG